MVEIDANGLTWIKSSASGDNSGSGTCVEVAVAAGRVLVRDRGGVCVVHSSAAWKALVAWVMNAA